jgi:hypothetical protein
MIGKISDRIHLMQNEVHYISTSRMSLEVQLRLSCVPSSQMLNDMGVLFPWPSKVLSIPMPTKDVERILFYSDRTHP